MPSKRELKAGDIVQITNLGPIWDWANESLAGAIVRVTDAHSISSNDVRVFDIEVLAGNDYATNISPYAYGKTGWCVEYIEANYKHLPKYATKHWNLPKEA